MLGCKRSAHVIEVDYPVFNPLEVSKEVLDLDMYIDTVELVPLISESPIYFDGKKMIVLNNGDLIFLTSSSILRFDKAGHHLVNFGKHGRGPGEYIKIYDICLNETQTELWAVNHVGEVMKYDLNTGKYIETISTELYGAGVDGLCPAENDGFFIYYANPTDFDNTDDFYCLLEYDKDGKKRGEYIKWADFNINYPYSPLISFNSGTYIIRPQENENVCYQINNGEVAGLCKIHFGKDNIPPLFAFKDGSDPREALGEIMPSTYYKTPLCIQQTDKHLFFSAVGPNAMQVNFLIDRETLSGINWVHEDENISRPFFILGSDENYLYGLFDSYTTYTSQEIEYLDPFWKYLIKTKEAKLDESDNPMVVKVKFK
jgi:hypothetical protein